MGGGGMCSVDECKIQDGEPVLGVEPLLWRGKPSPSFHHAGYGQMKTLGENIQNPLKPVMLWIAINSINCGSFW